MASQSEIDNRKAILRARGVPEAFIDNIANRKEMTVVAWLPLIVIWAIAAACFGAPIYFLNDISRLVLPLIYADSVDSLLFYPLMSNSDLATGIGFLSAFSFLVMSLHFWAKQFHHARPFPQYDALASSLRKMANYEGLQAIRPDPRFYELTHLTDDTAFLNAIRPSKKPIAATIIGTVMVIIPIAVVIFGVATSLSSYRRITLDSIDIHDGADVTTYRLADAKYAYVICYNSEDTIRFRYRIAYPDGVIDLWQRRDKLHDLGPEEVIDRLTLIDQRLTKLGIPIHRMPLEGSPRYDGQGCVKDAAYLWRLKNPDKLNRLVFGQ